MKRGEVALSEVEGQKYWFVYILECRDGSLYTGIAKNVEQRLCSQRNKEVHYTSYKLPVKLVFREKHTSQNNSARRERQLKGWTRKKKVALIRGDVTHLKQL